jgi:hypothetical protein
METYSDFIAQPSTQAKICEIAGRLEGYLQSNYNSLMPEELTSLLKNWLKNFEQFPEIDCELVLKLLDGLRISKDREIHELFITTLADKILPELNANLDDIYICSLGEDYESSYRLSAIFNRREEAPFYEPDINRLLKALKNKPNAVIVFFDDFLFSGGQIVCIFKKLLGFKLDTDDIDDIYADRTTISNPDLIEVFKRHRIVLYFHLAFLAGRENQKIKKLVKENGLKGFEIHVGHIESEDIGCFGTIRDVNLIKGGSTSRFNSGIFSGTRPADLKPLYDLLAEVGEQLLKNEHEEGEKWTNLAFKKHALGYGNKAKLILGEQNVPTSTLTALWLPSPDNADKKLTVGGRVVNWKSLFYRKPKRASVATILSQTENVYFKIPVKKIYDNTLLTDTYSYDLLTLLSLERRPNVCIYLREPNDKTLRTGSLNDIEEEIINCKGLINKEKRREWYAYNLEVETAEETSREVNHFLSARTIKIIGLVLTIKDLKGSFLFITRFLDTVFRSNAKITFSVVIDCPTRNVQLMERLKHDLSPTYLDNIYVSSSLSFEEPRVEKKVPFLKKNKMAHGNIMYCIENLLTRGDEQEQLKIQGLLGSIGAIEEKIDPRVAETDQFSQRGFIEDFSNTIMDGGHETADWQKFYLELLSVFDLCLPELIEGLFYFAAKSKCGFIRLSTLRHALAGGKLYLIDYWIQGSQCERESFENIETISPFITPTLFYPILRYYNRYKSNPALGKQIKELLSDVLNAQEHQDYPLAEMILGGYISKYLTDILSNNSVNLMKLFEAGVDVFEETDVSIWKNTALSEEMLYKMLLSAKMSTGKIKYIAENYQHLILAV